jgi:hypothetical protein
MGWSTAWIPPHTMTISQTMAATGFSRRSIQNLFRSGLLARIRFGGRVLVLRVDVERVVRRIGVFNGKRCLDPAVGPRRLRGPMVSNSNGVVPEIIEDMSRADIVETLRRLRLPHEESTCLLRLDRACRDYIVTALRSR